MSKWENPTNKLLIASQFCIQFLCCQQKSKLFLCNQAVKYSAEKWNARTDTGQMSKCNEFSTKDEIFKSTLREKEKKNIMPVNVKKKI